MYFDISTIFSTFYSLVTIQPIARRLLGFTSILLRNSFGVWLYFQMGKKKNKRKCNKQEIRKDGVSVVFKIQGTRRLLAGVAVLAVVFDVVSLLSSLGFSWVHCQWAVFAYGFAKTGLCTHHTTVL